MNGFDALPKEIRDKLTAKKYDRLERLPPIDQKDRWDLLTKKCELEDYEVNEILNAIKAPVQQG